MQIPVVGEGSLILVVSTGLAAVFLASYFARKDASSGGNVGPRKARQLPEGKNEFTAEEVALFDGKGPEGEPILTIIDGLVYDLQKGREFYREGGPYHPFVGRDCSRLLAKNQVSDKTDTGAPLTETELEQLEKWKEFFNNKYGSIVLVLQPIKSRLSMLIDMFQNPGGIQALLKEGGKHFSGMDEALLKNIDAAKQIGTMTRSSFGPFGLNKLIVNHLDKQFVTRDAAVILEEMEVVHPAAKLVVMAAKSQEQECGDGTNLVTIFAGELLNNAEELLKQGIHASDVVRGYELAIEEVVESMKSQGIMTVKDPRNVKELIQVLKPVLATKQYGQESFLAKLVAEACVAIMPEHRLSEFNPDNVRVATMTGSGVFANSHVLSGVVCPRDTMGNEKKKLKAKVAVFAIGIENAGPETSGTVLLKSANELLNFTKGEEARMEEFVKSLVAAGIDAIITGGNVQDIALHFLNKYRILVIKCTSKYELRRLCDTLGATALNRMGPPIPEEMGFAESIDVVEISNHKVTQVMAKDTKVATIVLRGATANMLAEVERSIVDAVNVVRCMCVKQELDFCAGGGATEIEVASAVHKFGDSRTGLEQYAIHKVAESLEVAPKVLAKNSGLDADETLAALNAAHSKGSKFACVNVDAQGRAKNSVVDAVELGIYDHLSSKIWALRLAMDAVLTVLRIQHIIVAKQAGGPRAPKGESTVDDD